MLRSSVPPVFANTGLKVFDTGGDHTTTVKQNSDEAADRVAKIPALGADDTFAMLGVANAFTARQTTTDGVSAGTAKVIGGRCTANVSAADSVTAVASANAFVSFTQTYSIPASTLGIGSVVKIRAAIRVSNASGTDTLTCNLLMGSTSLIATTAVDPGATTDHHILEFQFTSRAAAGGTASCVGSGRWITNTGGTIAHGTGLLSATNFATNGQLVVSSQAKWSSNTASTAALLESLMVEIL